MNPLLDRQLEMAVTTSSVADFTRLSEIVTVEDITR